MNVPSIRAVQALDVALSVHQPSVVAQLVADLERSRAFATRLETQRLDQLVLLRRVLRSLRQGEPSEALDALESADLLAGDSEEDEDMDN